MIFVLAGNYREFEMFMAKKELKEKAIYLSSEEKLRGYRSPTIIKVGTYYERKDLHRIKISAMAAQAEFVRGEL